MSDCAYGFEFDQPIRHVPARAIVRAAFAFMRTIAPAITVDVLSAKPSILNPLFQTVQRLHVALPGDEPNITDDVGEQTTLLGGHFAEKAVPWKERKKFFGSPKGGYMLDPQHVYTLEFYEDKLVPTTFDIAVPFMKFKPCPMIGSETLNPMPLQLCMGKVGFEPRDASSYIFNIEAWHEALYAGILSSATETDDADESNTAAAAESATADAADLSSSSSASVDVRRDWTTSFGDRTSDPTTSSLTV